MDNGCYIGEKSIRGGYLTSRAYNSVEIAESMHRKAEEILNRITAANSTNEVKSSPDGLNCSKSDRVPEETISFLLDRGLDFNRSTLQILDEINNMLEENLGSTRIY